MERRATFQIAFEGDAFASGEIDVRDLAPTLLAFGDIVQAASRALNGDRAEATLKIAATDQGSFIATLAVDMSWIVDMLDAVSANPDRVVAANQLMDLIIKGGTIVGTGWGLFRILKWLRGKRPDRVEELDDGMSSITFNGTTIIVPKETMALLSDLPTREAAQRLGRRAGAIKGLDRLKISEDSTAESSTLELEPSDFASLDLPPTEEEPETDVSHHEAWLKIVSVHFADGYKWRFSDGGDRPFTAAMEDTDFQKAVQAGEINLNANDAIRCLLREEQRIGNGNLTKEVFVEKVLDHRPGARQLTLL